MASTSIGIFPSILMLMRILLPLLLLFLLLLVHIRVIFIFVLLTFVASFTTVVMYHFFGDAITCMFTISVRHVVMSGPGVIVFEGCSVKTPGCLGLEMLLLVMRANRYSLFFPLPGITSFTTLSLVPVCEGWWTRARDTFFNSRKSREQVCESHFVLISDLGLLVERLARHS